MKTYWGNLRFDNSHTVWISNIRNNTFKQIFLFIFGGEQGERVGGGGKFKEGRERVEGGGNLRRGEKG